MGEKGLAQINIVRKKKPLTTPLSFFVRSREGGPGKKTGIRSGVGWGGEVETPDGEGGQMGEIREGPNKTL